MNKKVYALKPKKMQNATNKNDESEKQKQETDDIDDDDLVSTLLMSLFFNCFFQKVFGWYC
jgi:hypothetical protein